MTVNFESVERWISDDPDPQTAHALSELLQGARAGNALAEAALASQFGEFLQFGTAGLRGALGAGPSRMNRAVVIRTAAGLMGFLNKQVVAPRVVIGFDARYGSEQFAADTADVVGKYGGHALLFPRPLPTPVLAYAVRALEADAGVMVTASHNPPEDNGYKVYLGGRVLQGDGQGAQIVEPFDTQIATEIAAVTSAREVLARETSWDVEHLGEEVWEAYLDAIHTLADAGPRQISIVTTAMHGVGDETLQRVLARAGFYRVTSVQEQSAPDPDFPTVNFPNPEEPGALDLAMKTAERVGADLIIANDPDADRCSAAIPDVASATGWRQLSGDEIGAILGYYTAQKYVARQKPEAGSAELASNEAPVLANSIVSSRLLSKIAADHGLDHRATLTGFKWIARAPRLAFGYEEAIGYCVAPDIVRDKDGISAGLVLAMVAANYKEAGKTLADVLDEIALRYGLYATAPLSIRVADLSLIGQGMDNLRAHAPKELASSPVVEFVDLAQGSPELPPTNGILIRTAADDRVIVRPSGTEPKLKCYLEVVVPTEGDAVNAHTVASTRLAALSTQIRTILGI